MVLFLSSGGPHLLDPALQHLVVDCDGEVVALATIPVEDQLSL